MSKDLERLWADRVQEQEKNTRMAALRPDEWHLTACKYTGLPVFVRYCTVKPGMRPGACTVEVRQPLGSKYGWWVSWSGLPVATTDRGLFDTPLETIGLADRMLANGMRGVVIPFLRKIQNH